MNIDSLRRSGRLALLCVLIAAPATSSAQAKDEPEEFMRDVVMALFGAHVNVFAHGGATTQGRFILQSPAGGGERALRSETGYNVGGGVGVDFLLRTGLRLAYTYSTGELAFRTDDGDGTEALDVEDVGTLQSHVASIEIIRYMLPPQASVTPYASAGFVGTWFILDEGSTLVVPAGGSTQFRLGAIASIGLQMRFSSHLSARVEMASASVRNPFTGSESFRALGGATIDEPGRVGKTDFRLALVYGFGTPRVLPKR